MLKRTQSLQLILDLRCNSNCTVCGASWPFHPNLDTMQAITRLRRGIQIGLHEVIFSGGEVTLRRDLVKLIEIARELGYSSIVLLTNGRLLAKSGYLESLVQAGITSIGTSLHGHEAGVHELITRAPRSFDQTIDGIKAIRLNFPDIPLSVNCVLDGVNYKNVVDVVHLLLRLEVRSLQITYVVPVGKAKGIYFRTGMPRISETVPFIRNAVEVFENHYSIVVGASITLAFFPFCVLGDLASFSADFSQSISYFASETGDLVLIEDEISRQSMKTKRPECASCRFTMLCSGVWQEYIAARGWAEFIPITDYDPDQIFSKFDGKTQDSHR